MTGKEEVHSIVSPGAGSWLATREPGCPENLSSWPLPPAHPGPIGCQLPRVALPCQGGVLTPAMSFHSKRPASGAPPPPRPPPPVLSHQAIKFPGPSVCLFFLPPTAQLLPITSLHVTEGAVRHPLVKSRSLTSCLPSLFRQLPKASLSTYLNV